MSKGLLNDNELELKLATSPTPRVTDEYINKRIIDIQYTFMMDGGRKDDYGTICTIYFDNGYTVRGESVCVSEANFNCEIGKRISYDNAFRKFWLLFGFLLAETIF